MENTVQTANHRNYTTSLERQYEYVTVEDAITRSGNKVRLEIKLQFVSWNVDNVRGYH